MLVSLSTEKDTEVGKASHMPTGRTEAQERLGGAVTHQPHHEVGEHGDPQCGRDEGDHEELLPAGLAAVGDGDTQEEDEGPGEYPLSLVAFGLCEGVEEKDIGLHNFLSTPGLLFSS